MSENEFDRIKYLKNKMAPEELCQTPESGLLLKFIKEIFQMGFEDKPKYQFLRSLLIDSMNSLKEIPNNQYDWSS